MKVILSIIKQIVISSLLSLPAATMLFQTGDHLGVLVSYCLFLLSPPIVLHILFEKMKNEPGFDFRGTRIFIAWILWFIFGWIFLNSLKRLGDLSSWVLHNHGFSSWVDITLFAGCGLIGITATVILSYVIGKRVKTLSKE